MSLRSLLQLTLFFMIILIVGSIYFIYFYSGPIKNQIIDENLVKINEKNLVDQNITDQEILETIQITEEEIIKKKELSLEEDKNNKVLDVKKKENSSKKTNSSSNNNQIKINKNLKNDKMENLTKEIEYITSNEKGDIFKILAQYGKTNLENSSILDLEIVNGIVSSIERSTIYITSDYANYNYVNQNSKFYSNVIVKYDDKLITCDNLDITISDNIAVAYSNVIVKDSNSIMKTQIMTLDLVTKDININSRNDIKINTN